MSERPPIVDLHIAGVGAARLVRSDEHSLIYRTPHETRGHDVDVEILPGSQGEAARERFAREKQALGRLAGVEGVVPLIEAGVTVDGDLYLMTPTLGGRTLAEIIDAEGPMAWPEAMRIIEAAAATLHHAHVVGVTHRRIDPDTIVVADDGRVLITGLGSAGLTMDAAGASLPAVDRPGYRAPELSVTTPAGVAATAGGDAMAGAEPVDAGPAGDIYGLGATLWALLAGRRPFTTADGDDRPAAIVERAATQRVGDLRLVAPASVAEAVEWATTIEPERRPSSAATFARALREAAARVPSGFVTDPDAVVAGWQPLRDPEEFGVPGEPDELEAAGETDRATGRSSLAAAVAASGLDGASAPTDPAPANAAPATGDPGHPEADDGSDTGVSPGDHRATIRTDATTPATAVVHPGPTKVANGIAGDSSDESDDGRRAGLLVALGIATIVLVALAASAVLVAFVGEQEPVTISGPSIESGEDEVPAEVLGVEVEADRGSAEDRLTAGPGRDGDAATGDADTDADDGDAPGEGADAPPGQSAVIEPFAIPTPTPVTTGLPAAPGSGAAVVGPTQSPAQPSATARPTPGTSISAPPPRPSPTPTPTPETIISAPPAPPPAPTSSPTPMPTIAPGPTPTPTPVPPTPAPSPTPTTDPVEVTDTPN